MTEGMATPPRKRGRPRRSSQVEAGSKQKGKAQEADIHSISGKLGLQIGAKLHHVRIGRGLTQQDLAKGTFSKSYISAIEHGKIKPSLRALVYLAERLDLPVAYFLDGSDLDDGSSAPGSVGAARFSVADAADLKLAQADHLSDDQPQSALSLLRELDIAQLSPAQQLRRNLLLAEINVTLRDDLAARTAIEQADRLTQNLGDHEASYKLRSLEAELEAQEGRPEIAATRYQALIPAARSGAVKQPSLRLSIYMGLGNALRKLGRSAEAATTFNSALAAIQDADNVDHLAATLWRLSTAAQAAGELGRARDYATRSLALRDAADGICQIITIYTSLAEIAQQLGHWDEAQGHLEAALAVAEQLRDDYSCAEALHGLSRLVFKREQLTDDLLKQAEDYANRCLDAAHKSADDELIGKALAVVGTVQDAEGNPAASDRSYQQAIAQLKQAQADRALSETYFEYAQLLRKRGDTARAGEYLEQAYLLGRGLLRCLSAAQFCNIIPSYACQAIAHVAKERANHERSRD